MDTNNPYWPYELNGAEMKEKPILFSTPMVAAIKDGTKTVTRRILKPQPVLRADVVDPTGITTNGWWWTMRNGCGVHSQDTAEECVAKVLHFKSPYGNVGDRLWVRETWRLANINPTSKSGQFWTIQFKDFGVLPHPQPDQSLFLPLAEKDTFTPGQTGIEFGKWRPSIFLPRWASRCLLEKTGEVIERLQNITEEQASAEGFHREGCGGEGNVRTFARLWEKINGGTCKTCKGHGIITAWSGSENCGNIQQDSADCPKCHGQPPEGSWEANPFVRAISFKVVEFLSGVRK